MRAHASMAAAAAATLLLLLAPGVPAAEPKPTLEDCKAALQSLSTPPHSTALPFMAASTGACGLSLFM
jgi:hypothetical protein